jgi:hypothetical protein
MHSSAVHMQMVTHMEDKIRKPGDILPTCSCLLWVWRVVSKLATGMWVATIQPYLGERVKIYRISHPYLHGSPMPASLVWDSLRGPMGKAWFLRETLLPSLDLWFMSMIPIHKSSRFTSPPFILSCSPGYSLVWKSLLSWFQSLSTFGDFWSPNLKKRKIPICSVFDVCFIYIYICCM